MLSLQCPACETGFAVQAALAARRICCPVCQAPIPGPSAVPALDLGTTFSSVASLASPAPPAALPFAAAAVLPSPARTSVLGGHVPAPVGWDLGAHPLPPPSVFLSHSS